YGGIAQTVAYGLAERDVLLLQRVADLTQLVPGVWELVRTAFLDPVLPVVPDAVAVAEGDALPPAVDDVDLAVDVVAGAVSLGDLLHDIVDVGEAVRIEMWPVVDHHDDVGPGFRLDGRRDPGIEIVHVDQVDGDLDTGQLAELARES